MEPRSLPHSPVFTHPLLHAQYCAWCYGVNQRCVINNWRAQFIVGLLFSCQAMSGSFSAAWAVRGIFQVRILEWVAFPSPGDLSEPGIEPGAPAMSSALQVSSLLLSHQGSPSLSCINLTGGAQETSL